MEGDMTKMRFLSIALMTLCLCAGSILATDVSMRISGPGAINDSTIKVGEPVSVDIYWSNDKDGRRAFTTGFALMSEDIKKVIHVPDSGNGLNENGDLKGHNGWEGTAVWDFAGVWTPAPDWDGTLPDTIGFGGNTVNSHYDKHEEMKVLSMDLIIPETGTLVIDSSFCRPGSFWKFASGEKPNWHGPYTFHVVK